MLARLADDGYIAREAPHKPYSLTPRFAALAEQAAQEGVIVETAAGETDP